MATATGSVFDFGSVYENAKKADAIMDSMVDKSIEINKNMHNAFKLSATGGYDNFMNGLKELLNVSDKLKDNKVSINVDSSKLVEIKDAFRSVIENVNLFQRNKVELFDTKGLYATEEFFLSIQKKLNKLREDTKKLEEEWRQLGEKQHPSNVEVAFNLRKIPREDGSTISMQDALKIARQFNEEKRAEALVEREVLEERIKANKETEAILEKELSVAKMTQDEKSSYIINSLRKVFREEQSEINKIRAEYKKLWQDLRNFSSSRASIDKASEGKVLTADQQQTYDYLLEAEMATEDKIQAMYREHQEILSEITMRESAKRAKSIAEELKNQKFDAITALNMAANARTGEQMERAKEAVKGAVMTVDKDDVDVIKALNKAYIDLRAGIENLTKAQNNEKTLQPTIRNEYERILKEIDKVTEAKEKLAATTAYTEAKGDDNAQEVKDYEALEQRLKDLGDRRKEIEDGNQGLLTEIVRKHEAERAKIRTEAIDSHEKKIKESLEKIASISSIDANKVISESKSTQNIKQSEKAIQDLKNARDRLNESDANYDDTLRELNDEIKKHEENIERVTNAERYRQKQEDKERSTTEGALKYSKEAKSVIELQKAIQYLKNARDNENLDTEEGRRNYEELNEELRTQEELVRRLGGTFGDTSRRMLNLGDQLKRSIALVFSVSQIRGYINNMVQVRGEFELQQRALQAIIQNKDEANEVWKKTIDLAVQSPFRVKELVTYTKQLAAYRIETEKLYETNKMLADVSAGLGVDMDRLILAFGQVRSASYLRGTELRQFTEAGIPMLEELAKYFSEIEGVSVSVGQVFDRISKRLVDFEDVEEIFKRLTSAGGAFYKMQEIQAETLKGQISNLRDSLDIMLNDIGKSTEGVLSWSISKLKFFVENWESLAVVLKGIIYLWSAHKVSVLLSNKALERYARMQGIVSTGMGNMKKIIALVIHSFKKLGHTLGNTFKKGGWFIGITLLIEAITSIISHNRRFKESLQEVNDAYNEQLAPVLRLNKEYKELNESEEQGVDVLKEKKKVLEELVGLGREYGIDVEVNLKEINQENIDNIVNQIRTDIIYAIDWGKEFGVALQTGLQKSNRFLWINWTSDLERDLRQYEEAAAEIGGGEAEGAKRAMEDIVNSYYMLDDVVLKNAPDKIKKFLESFKIDRQDGESSIEYVSRMRDSANELLVYLTESGIELSNKGNISLLKPFFEFNLEEVNKQKADVLRELRDISNAVKKEYGVEDFSHLTDKQQEGILFQIQAEFKKLENVSEETKEWMTEYVAEQLGITYAPKQNDAVVKSLEAWQLQYNKFIGQFSKTSRQYIKDIEKVDESREDVTKKLKENIELNETIVNAFETGSKAYTRAEYLVAKQALSDANMALEWIAGKSGKDAKEKASNNLKDAIGLIKEMNKEYEKGYKTFGDKAEGKVSNAYSKTFKETFSGLGIDFTEILIDKDKLRQLSESGEQAGVTFTEAMKAEMEKLATDGTYIRNFSEDFANSIKEREGMLFTATDVEKKGKGLTIGHGEYQTYKDTGELIKEGDTITEGEAWRRLTEIILPQYADSLNTILDANKDLILTQEQYNSLLDLTYQGGSGATKKLIQLARNEEEAVSHIENIRKLVSETMGEEAAERFGESFISKIKDAETIYERIALLLQTMNLTVSGEVSSELYEGMQKRSDERSESFSGMLSVVNLLSEAAIDVSNIDFTNIEGVVGILKKLRPWAKKQGKEAAEALEKEIAKLDAQIGVELKENSDKKIVDKVQEIFDEYNLSLEIKKLDIPKTLAKSLFDVDYLSFDELKDKIVNQFVEGTEEGKDILITELSNDLINIDWNIVEGIVGEDQMKQIKESLEKVDDLEDKDSIERMKKYSKYLKKSMSERVNLKIKELRELEKIESSKEFSDSQKERIKAGVSKEAREEQDKQAWKDFQGTEMYTSMFSDLEFLGTKALGVLKNKLEELKGSLKDLPASEVKEIVSQISKIEDIMMERNPFQYRSTLREDLEALKSEEDLFNDLSEAQTSKDKSQAMIDSYNLWVENGRAQKDLSEEQKQALFDMFDIYRSTGKTVEEQIEDQEDNVKLQDQNIATAQEGLDLYQDMRKVIKVQADYWNAVGAEINKAFNSSKELMEMLGYESDSVEMSLVNSAQSMTNLVMQTIQYTLAMKAAGVAAKSAAGVVGWIALGIEALVSILSAVFSFKDAQIQAQLDDYQNKIDELKKSYEELEKQMDKAFSTYQLQAYYRSLSTYIYKQQEALRKMIAIEEDQKESRQDKEQINAWKDELKSLEEQLNELQQDLLEGVGGVTDYRSQTRGFVDSWIDAFNETGDGLKGLQENFQDFFNNIIAEQATLKITEKFLEPFYKQINDYLSDYELTSEEAKKLREEAQRILPDVSEALEQVWVQMGGRDGIGSLSGLQKGISGITEDQADIISSYLNSLRFIASDNNNELKSQTRYLRATYDMLSAMTGIHSKGGRGFKVIL